MSKLNRLDPTAGGDAPVVEKTDCVDDAILLSTIELKCSEDETTAVEEVSTLNVQAETECLKAINDSLGKEIADPNTTEIIHVATEDAVILIDAQESEVKSSAAIALQSEETPQSKSANEEKVKKEIINNQLWIATDCGFIKIIILIILFFVNYLIKNYFFIVLFVVFRLIIRSLMRETTMQRVYPVWRQKCG